MTRKWRPFWSYDVEKTERWLSEMAAEGKRLVAVKIWTRMFLFEETELKKADFQICYDRTKSSLPHRLKESGWENEWSEGSWRFLKNTSEMIDVFPVREGILNRNRLHSNIATVIAFLNGMQAFIMMTILFVIMSSSGAFEGEGRLWWAFGIPIVQSVALILLAVYATRKLRAFERKYFSSTVDVEKPVGRTFGKWKFGWLNAPDLLENWLSDMAAEGNHLVRVQGRRFIFEVGEPKHASYVYDYQLKASSNYFDIHKSAGWELKFTSPYSIIKFSLWMKEYDAQDKKPRFTYDAVEKEIRVRKVVLASGGEIIFSLLLLTFALWINLSIYLEEGWTIFGRVIVGAIIISYLIPFFSIIRALKYAIRMRKNIVR